MEIEQFITLSDGQMILVKVSEGVITVEELGEQDDLMGSSFDSEQ